MILFASLLCSCVQAPKKPEGHLKAINAMPTSAPRPYARTYNLETDFDENLKLRSDAKPINVEIKFEDLHKNWCMDPATKEELVRFALQWKEHYLKLERELNELKSSAFPLRCE